MRCILSIADRMKCNITSCFSVNFAGIAFPTCISVNNCICHFSPLKSEPDLEIKPGDIVKMYVYILHYSHFCLFIVASLAVVFVLMF